MKKITVFLIAFQVLLIAACKKQVCFKCRDVDSVAVYVKGTDTIYLMGNASGRGIQNLIDSGYIVRGLIETLQSNYIILCNDEGVTEIQRPYCEKQ
jgi:hypothetical protein